MKILKGQKVFTIGNDIKKGDVVVSTTFVKYLPYKKCKSGKNYRGESYLQDCITNSGFDMLNCSASLYDTRKEAKLALKEKKA